MRRMIVASAKRLGIALTVMAVVVAPARVADAAAEDAGSRPAFGVSSPAAAADRMSAVNVTASSKAASIWYVQFRNWKTNNTKCMGVEGGQPANGSRVVLWGCGSPDHVWRLETSKGFYEIRNNVNPGKCLGVLGGSRDPGAPLVTWDCDNSDNQKWEWQPSSVCGGIILVNKVRTQPLDEPLLVSVEGGSTQDNASIIQWTHASSPDQTWCTFVRGTARR
jgi:hypothetical protein